ncbi:MAG: spore coat protein CotJB [Clostridia bacterium]|nr:spore coat protein CotJB [Clostridia bacterium]
MNGEKDKLMRTLQILGFAIVETNLFLDTHPDCKKALAFLNELIKKRDEATAEYAAKYGPVTAAGSAYGGAFTWAEAPWPWEYGFESGETGVNA